LRIAWTSAELRCEDKVQIVIYAAEVEQKKSLQRHSTVNTAFAKDSHGHGAEVVFIQLTRL